MIGDRWDEIRERHQEKLEQYTVLTPQEVMEILNIGQNSMYHMLNSGQLPAFRVGRSWRITLGALEDYMLRNPGRQK